MKRLGMTAALAAATILGAGPAVAQTTISTLGSENGTVSQWGLPRTAAYGQTFTVAGATRLDRVTFRIDDNRSGNAGVTPISYQFQVFAWNAATRRATGLSLGSTTGATSGSGRPETVVVETGGVDLPSAGQYVVFLQATSNGRAAWARTPGTAYADGSFVSQNNSGNTANWTTRNWTVTQSRDLVFELLFDVVDHAAIAAAAADALMSTAATSARLVVLGADGLVRDAGQVSIATRKDQIVLTRTDDDAARTNGVISTQGAPGLTGNLYTWAELTGFRSDDFGTGTGRLSGGGLQIGADVAVGPDMVAGLSLGHTKVSSSDAGTTNDGDYTYLQPYFAYRSGAWAGTASLIWGKGAFDQNGGAGTADVKMSAVSFEGGYDHALRGGLTLTPPFGLIHGREDTDGTGGTLAGTSSDVTFTQASIGARLTRDMAQGSLFAGLHADYLTNDSLSVLAQNLLANDGWTGRLEVGGDIAVGNGARLSTTFEVSGLGGDMQTATGALKIGLRF